VKELIKQILKEEVGVPNNIVNVANQIFNHIINNLTDTETVEEINNVTKFTKVNFK